MNARKIELNKYYREVSNALFCPLKTRKKILNSLKCGINNYLDANPEATISEIYTVFGSPHQIAASYLEELPTPDLINKIKLRKTIFKGVITVVGITALLCLVLWIVAIVTALISVHNNSDPYYEIITEERP